jgi:hypothetical protein
MKPILQWYKSVDDAELRAKLLRNGTNVAMPTKTLADAIKGGIVWSETKEGYQYWRRVYEKAAAGRISALNKNELLQEEFAMEFAKWTHSADCNHQYSGVGDVWLQLDDIPQSKITTKELLTIFQQFRKTNAKKV